MRKFLLTVVFSMSMLLATQVAFAHSIAKIDHEFIDGKYGMCVYLPKLEYKGNIVAQDTINNLMRQPIDNSIKEYKKNYDTDKVRAKERGYCYYLSYAVKFNKNELFSMTINGYQYTGGAHGNGWQDSVVANLSTGQIYTLKDLFKQEVDYKEVLNKIIKAQNTEPNVEFKSVDEKTQFYITEEALVIYYQQYEIAAYVYGMPTFVIPCKQIKDLFTDEIQSALQRK